MLDRVGSEGGRLKVYEVQKMENLREKFHGALSIPEEPVISSSVREIGWIDTSSSNFTALPAPRTFNRMSCILSMYTSSFSEEYDTYHPLHCAWTAGNFVHFFTFNRLDDVDDESYNVLFRAQPSFKNRTDVRYAIAERIEWSMFGVQKRFVPSKTLALLQILHYPNILGNIVDRTDRSLLKVLKEQNVWAILGMVSGNSMIQHVDVESKKVHAAVDELFICGVGILVLFCVLLFVYSCATRCSADCRFRVPVSDADLLRQLRATDERRHGISDGDPEWPDMCLRTNAEQNEYLAFCGPPRTP